MSDRDKLGRRGEKLAARHLRRNGYRIVERNFRCPPGATDIIAHRPDETVFVEVKTRRSAEFEPPEVNVTPAKRRGPDAIRRPATGAPAATNPRVSSAGGRTCRLLT